MMKGRDRISFKCLFVQSDVKKCLFETMFNLQF